MSTLAHGFAVLAFFLLGVQLGRTSNSVRGDLADCGVYVTGLGVTETTLEGGLDTNRDEGMSVGADAGLMDGGLVAGGDGGLAVGGLVSS